MSKVSEFIFNSISFVVYILFVAMYFVGLYHAFNKHNDGLLSVFVFPVAMYHGVEILWHDDFSGVDWDKKLSNDVKTCIYFMNNVDSKEVSTFKFNQDIEEFSKIISKYPNDKKDYLKNACKTYFDYMMSIMVDMRAYTDNITTLANMKFKFSNNTIKQEEKLSKYFSKEDMDILKKGFDMFINSNDNMKAEQYLDNSKILDAYDLLVKKANVNLKAVYKNIFNEELI